MRVAAIVFLIIFSASSVPAETEVRNPVKHLKDFEVIEFRRYTVKEGKREEFAMYFETFFPEAFQQMGSILFGHFYERKNRTGFTWMRGFKNMDSRAIVNSGFYYGPVWREHGFTMNHLMEDASNVLLFRPLKSENGVLVLPAVDPVIESKGAQGVIVAHLFPVQKNQIDAFAQKSEPVFATYREAGAREAGVLVTLDAPNTFPQLPVRTDGPFLVWLGILKDNQALESTFQSVAERAQQTLSATGLLRGEVELVILDPSHRSRLRWVQ